jgi:hypothetical protein
MFSINSKERNGKTPTTLPVAAVIIVSNNRIKHIGSALTDHRLVIESLSQSIELQNLQSIPGHPGGKLKKNLY